MICYNMTIDYKRIKKMSDKLLLCPDCQGRKKVSGMGMMVKDCVPCGGLGWISVPELPEIVKTTESTLDEIPTAKKRGRKCKQIDSI